MLHFHALAEFSCTNCLGICAFLVPANLLATLQTMLFTHLRSPRRWVNLMVVVSAIYALLMVWHVLIWFALGVVMAPTFILLSLGMVCLLINAWALAHSASLAFVLSPMFWFIFGLFRRSQPLSVKSLLSANPF